MRPLWSAIGLKRWYHSPWLMMREVCLALIRMMVIERDPIMLLILKGSTFHPLRPQLVTSTLVHTIRWMQVKKERLKPRLRVCWKSDQER